MVLRIEDLDPARSKPEFVQQIFKDLEWFGFDWEGEVLYQSSRSEAYRKAFLLLEKEQLTYPCFCTRADLHSAQAPHVGEEYVYAGTCKTLTRDEILKKGAVSNPAFRLMVPDSVIELNDLFQGPFSQNLKEDCGDYIIKRKDGVFAYQLAVVIDDAYQNVGSVIRGIDLLSSSPRQQYLQDLLSIPHVEYGHVPLLLDEEGRRLSKRNKDASLEYLQEQGVRPEEILGYLSYSSEIIPEYSPLKLEELVQYAHLANLKGKKSITWNAEAFLAMRQGGVVSAY